MAFSAASISLITNAGDSDCSRASYGQPKYRYTEASFANVIESPWMRNGVGVAYVLLCLVTRTCDLAGWNWSVRSVAHALMFSSSCRMSQSDLLATIMSSAYANPGSCTPQGSSYPSRISKTFEKRQKVDVR